MENCSLQIEEPNKTLKNPRQTVPLWRDPRGFFDLHYSEPEASAEYFLAIPEMLAPHLQVLWALRKDPKIAQLSSIFKGLIHSKPQRLLFGFKIAVRDMFLQYTDEQTARAFLFDTFTLLITGPSTDGNGNGNSNGNGNGHARESFRELSEQKGWIQTTSDEIIAEATTMTRQRHLQSSCTHASQNQ
ncbi:MAG: hypothetical protein PHG63_02625 [Candidatus Dojkabacteria bacterium]|nr:hypothetical protein [Candidatus Dojkabacteria bacterium]